MTRAVRPEACRRAVIYARYSSEQQREESIADQIEICRRYVERQGWTLQETYSDAAISGASRFRPGLERMTADAQAKRFDVIVCEAVDRLGRRLADVATLFDRLVHCGIDVHTTSIGLLTPMHVGIMGTIAQMTLADLREKTRRGQLGRARAGRMPGGLAYGYEVVPPPPGVQEAGERRIVQQEAEVVRQIFSAYAAGTSPRTIARNLNAAGVPGPGGRPWGDTTIRGQVDRGTGILNNTIYIGRLSWNRCSYVKDPATGRRVARPNSSDCWEVVEIPALRIVDQTTWDRCRARQTEIALGPQDSGGSLNATHRPVFLLSGLLRCGCCGGAYTTVDKDRLGCATRRSKGTCDNGRTIIRQAVEHRVLDGLRDRMLSPDLVATFVREFEAETARLRREANGRRSIDETRLAEVERRIAAIVTAIENGGFSAAVATRLNELEAEQATLRANLTSIEATSPVVVLHPNAADRYRDRVADLVASLSEPSIRTEAADVLRSLIDRVVLTPDAEAPDRLRVELSADLAMIMSVASGGTPCPAMPGARAGGSGGQLSVVAGTGFEPALTTQSKSFRSSKMTLCGVCPSRSTPILVGGSSCLRQVRFSASRTMDPVSAEASTPLVDAILEADAIIGALLFAGRRRLPRYGFRNVAA